MNKRHLRLNLDEIENISDCDLESNKNTSAWAVTFNQFELTKNVIMNHKYQEDENDTLELDNTPGRSNGGNHMHN